MNRKETMMRALSSPDGKSWHDKTVFPYPEDVDEGVSKIVLGSLDKDDSVTMDDAQISKMLEHFPKVTHLYLWGIRGVSQIENLPAGLVCLDLRSCKDLVKIPVLPDTVEDLDLGGCEQITEVRGGSFPALKRLWLDGCLGLKRFKSFENRVASLVQLVLHGCRFDDLPDVLCGEKNQNVVQLVQSHFQSLSSEGIGILSECKIVVLGNGGVGKTEMVRALKGLPLNKKQPSTEGIFLWKWNGDGFAPFPEQGVNHVELNIWDFGGQDLYHNTHRLFLESRAVFVVVVRQAPADGSRLRPEPEFENDPVRPPQYWFDQIYAANPHARVIVVRTGKDEDIKNPPEDWRLAVRAEFRELPYYEVSSWERSDDDWQPLKQQILEDVRSELRSAESVRMGKGRVAVREKISEWQPETSDVDSIVNDSPRPLMRMHEFTTLAREEYERLGLGEPSEQEIGDLLDYLHHSGAVYCPEEWRKRERMKGAFPLVIDQRWAVEAIYSLIKNGSPTREKIVSRHGHVKRVMLEEAWSGMRDENGEKRYDDAAQWVFLRFMKSCGLIVDVEGQRRGGTGENLMFPEFLPDWETLRSIWAENSLIKKVQESAARHYFLKDSKLGQGFGCLLVAQLVEVFGKSPLYRYGGVGRVELSGIDAESREVVVQLSWFKEKIDHFHGSLAVGIWGSKERDAEVLKFLRSELNKISGFPDEADFECPDECAILDSLSKPVEFVRIGDRRVMMDPEMKERVQPIPILGRIGISFAGKSDKFPDIELFPAALEECLKRVDRRCFEIRSYRTNREAPIVKQFVSDLVTSDLMIAFAGNKYLHSEYCMVEMLEAARHWQQSETFSNPERWPHHLWIVPLPDAGYLLSRGDLGQDGESAASNWVNQWVKRGRLHRDAMEEEFPDDEIADEQAPSRYVYHTWMRFAAGSQKQLRAILAAMRGQRLIGWSAKERPHEVSREESQKWAETEVEELAVSAGEKVVELVTCFSKEQRRARAYDYCRRMELASKKERAIEGFGMWLEEHDDRERAATEALGGQANYEGEKLQTVYRWWLEAQGVHR